VTLAQARYGRGDPGLSGLGHPRRDRRCERGGSGHPGAGGERKHGGCGHPGAGVKLERCSHGGPTSHGDPGAASPSVERSALAMKVSVVQRR